MRSARLGLRNAGQPWENGYIESFNARLRDELLNGEIFYCLREAQIVLESWRATTTQNVPTLHSAIAHRHRKSSSPPSSRGRLRNPGQLRRPRSHCAVLHP